MFPKIAVIGQPNVGKSTLFNLLCKKKIALSGDSAGITRDRKKFLAQIFEYGFYLIDTPGFENNKGKLTALMKEQIILAIEEADAIFFIVESHLLPTIDTIELAKIVRKHDKVTLLLANKADLIDYYDESEHRKLGLGAPIPISATCNYGIENVVLKLEQNKIPLVKFEAKKEDTIPVAILGKPNVGKSTLFNKLTKMGRVIISDVPGTTVDSISEIIEFEGKKIEIIDTAGLRKRNKIDNDIEHFSAGSSISAIKRAAVILLMIDAEKGFTTQDLNILSVVVNEGKSLILLVNKMDMIKNKKDFVKDITYYIEKRVNEIKGAPILFISAQSISSTKTILNMIIDLHIRFNITVNTSYLNRILRSAVEKHMPPIVRGRRLKFKYIVQTATKPPSFNIFTNLKEHVPKHYNSYIVNELRKELKLEGTVIRTNYVQVKNPYIK